MNKCCKDLFEEIKQYIKEQADMYKTTRRYSIGLAIQLLYDDLVYKYEGVLTESKVKE
jgi:hypothetical protein